MLTLFVPGYAFFLALIEFILSLSMQKGTVVEKLVEETANNDQHLRHLISICEGK